MTIFHLMYENPCLTVVFMVVGGFMLVLIAAALKG